MNNSNFSQNNELSSKNNSLEKQANTYLSETEDSQKDKEINALLKELSNVFFSDTHKVNNQRKKTDRLFSKLKQQYVESREKVKKLREISSVENLNAIEIEIEASIRRVQANAQVASSIVPVLALFIILLFFRYERPVLDLLSYLLNALGLQSNNSIIGIPGVFAFLVILLNLKAAIDRKDRIDMLEKCLFLIKKAKIEPNETEDDNFERLKHLGNHQSLLSQLKNIKIHGPEDFAENFDLYMSGEKRIEPDIR